MTDISVGDRVVDREGVEYEVVGFESKGRRRGRYVRVTPLDGTKSRLKSPNVLTVMPAGKVPRIDLLEAEIKELRSRASRDMSSDVHAERIAQAIEYNTPTTDIKFDTLDYDESDAPHVHNLLLSDLHYGEYVDPEQVNGLNAYDTQVCERRVAQVVESLVSFKDNRPYDINKLVISALGDNCSGGPGIHDEIRETNLVTASEQAHDVGMLLGKTVEELLQYYPEVEFVGVSGNHPRMAKPHASKNVFDSFDWIGYRTAEVYLRHYVDDGRVAFFAPRAAMTTHVVAGRTVLLWHGDGVRTSMPGVPWGGVMRRWNELRKQFSSQGVRLDSLQLGHYHQANVIQAEIFMNGSIVGLNEYGLKNFGSGSAPCQLLLTYDESRSRLTDVSYITPTA